MTKAPQLILTQDMGLDISNLESQFSISQIFNAVVTWCRAKVADGKRKNSIVGPYGWSHVFDRSAFNPDDVEGTEAETEAFVEACNSGDLSAVHVALSNLNAARELQGIPRLHAPAVEWVILHDPGPVGKIAEILRDMAENPTKLDGDGKPIFIPLIGHPEQFAGLALV